MHFNHSWRYTKFILRLNWKFRFIKPWVVCSISTDCDGMHCGEISFHWTQNGVERELETLDGCSDGKVYASISRNYSAKYRHDTAAVHNWADNHDRYAESMNY